MTPSAIPFNQRPMDEEEMAILVLDTSAAAISVGIVATHSGDLLASETRTMSRGQVEALLPMVAQAHKRSGIEFTDLTAIAATVGPGSFTGIRLGLAAARGIGLAAARPVFGLSCFEANLIAFRARRPNLRGTLLILLDSKRRDVFTQAFTLNGDIIRKPEVLCREAVQSLIEELIAIAPSPLWVTGDAAEIVADPGVPRLSLSPLPVTALASLARRLWLECEPGKKKLPPASPLYLRPPDAALPRDGGVLPHLLDIDRQSP